MNIRPALAVAPLVLLVACSGNKDQPAAAGGPITVEASDDACKVARTAADAGNITFEIANKGTKVTEFYLYAEGDRILGEVENIGPGLTRRLIVEVPDGGKFQTACKPGMVGNGIRGDFTVSGGVPKAADANAQLGEATKNYQRFVNSQTESLVPKTTEFVNAVKAGKVDEAKALYPVARIYWERIEPVAESFSDIDEKTDTREPDLKPGQEFTGWHRLEKDLWVSGLQPDSAKVADQLLADITDLAGRTKSVELTPVQLANGAKELLDEVATGKITGEEDQYSHTDLYDFRSNVDGSQAAVAALRPVIDSKDKTLGTTLDQKFAAVDKLLEKQRKGDGFKLYNELTQDEIKEFAAAVDALGEPVSKVAEVVTAK
ncbi:iron uptake system protein EfeO [Actinocrispum wychmicini]|uniref:Iron uptake system component EfeO n=1 Tax=Actinocrispum wychmicini TaxID=1213861 RepID=A0A4V2S736_9PSEU|nr:iron uptake system component EfeO [Actinocrispum wychmicini]